MIYALLSQNFVVEIYALFPQNILDWGADSANFFAFWMYGDWLSQLPKRKCLTQKVIISVFKGFCRFSCFQ